MKFRFPVFIIDEDFRSENASGLGIRALAKAIEDEGLEVLGVTSYGDLSSFAQQQSRASAFILSIDDEEFFSPEAADKAIADLRTFVKEIRFRNAEIPIFLHGETRTSRHIPNDVLRELHGFIHMGTIRFGKRVQQGLAFRAGRNGGNRRSGPGWKHPGNRPDGLPGRAGGGGPASCPVPPPTGRRN